MSSKDISVDLKFGKHYKEEIAFKINCYDAHCSIDCPFYEEIKNEHRHVCKLFGVTINLTEIWRDKKRCKQCKLLF